MDKTELFELLHDVIAVLDDEQNRAVKAGDYIWALKYSAMIGAVRDACGMLTPRVLTVEELKAHTEYDEPFIIESQNGRLTWATYYAEYLNNGTPIVRMVDFDGQVDDRIKADYDYGWRCWTLKPTDEERAAVSWEE